MLCTQGWPLVPLLLKSWLVCVECYSLCGTLAEKHTSLLNTVFAASVKISFCYLYVSCHLIHESVELIIIIIALANFEVDSSHKVGPMFSFREILEAIEFSISEYIACLSLNIFLLLVGLSYMQEKVNS